MSYEEEALRPAMFFTQVDKLCVFLSRPAVLIQTLWPFCSYLKRVNSTLWWALTPCCHYKHEDFYCFNSQGTFWELQFFCCLVHFSPKHDSLFFLLFFYYNSETVLAVKSNLEWHTASCKGVHNHKHYCVLSAPSVTDKRKAAYKSEDKSDAHFVKKWLIFVHSIFNLPKVQPSNCLQIWTTCGALLNPSPEDRRIYKPWELSIYSEIKLHTSGLFKNQMVAFEVS